MKLFFSQSVKLFKKIHLILIAISIIIIVSTFFTKGLGISLMYGFVLYVLGRIIISYLVNLHDSKRFAKVLDIFYDGCNPLEFLNIINNEIDYSILDKEQTTTLLIHRANALAFSGENKEAFEILETLDSKGDTLSDDKLLILNNRVTLLLLDCAFNNKEINENIFKYSIEQLKKEGSPYKNNSIQDKIIYKIIHNIKLSDSEIDDLWLFIKHSGSSLNRETLYYFAAIHLFNDGDRVGAIEELKQIDVDSKNTIVQRAALKYLEEIRE